MANMAQYSDCRREMDSTVFAAHEHERRRGNASVHRDRSRCRWAGVRVRSSAGLSSPTARRDVPQVSRECSVRPLTGSLTFLKGGPNWGIAFRRPVFAVSKDNFERIADEMGADVYVS